MFLENVTVLYLFDFRFKYSVAIQGEGFYGSINFLACLLEL